VSTISVIHRVVGFDKFAVTLTLYMLAPTRSKL
jgi:hypothetical protein